MINPEMLLGIVFIDINTIKDLNFKYLQEFQYSIITSCAYIQFAPLHNKYSPVSVESVRSQSTNAPMRTPPPDRTVVRSTSDTAAPQLQRQAPPPVHTQPNSTGPAIVPAEE